MTAYRLGMEGDSYAFALLETANLSGAILDAAALIREHGRMRTGRIAEAAGVTERAVREWAAQGQLRRLGIVSDGAGWHEPEPPQNALPGICTLPGDLAQPCAQNLDMENPEVESLPPPSFGSTMRQIGGRKSVPPTGASRKGAVPPIDDDLDAEFRRLIPAADDGAIGGGR